MARVRGGFFFLAVAAGWFVAVPTRASADDAALSAAFARMIASPDDPEAAFDYARIAAADGQARAAISALERVLRINPRLDNIRLELASLYMAVGSPDLAAMYAREALSSPDIPPDVAERARKLLAGAEKASSRSLLQVNLFTGFRWDSNATQATALAAVPIFVPAIQTTVAVNPGVRAQPDGSWVTSAQLSHRYDLGLQTEGAWETNFSWFDQRYFHINHAYDLDILQLDTGPQFGVGQIGDAAISIRPFFSTNYIAYGDRPYAALYGGGLSGQAVLSAETTVDVTALGRFGNYYNTSFRPLARDYTGPEYTVLAGVSHALTPNIILNADVSYYWADARANFYTRNGPGGDISLNSAFEVRDFQVGTVARLGLRRLSYDSPDPLIDPTQKRVDNIFDAGLSLIVPLTERLRLVTQYSYYRQNSSYSIYSFNDHSVSIGLRLDL